MDSNSKSCELNPETAEILGAFLGDGWIQSKRNTLFIAGSSIDDVEYYDCHIAPLFSKHFSSVKPRKFAYWGNVYGILTSNKEAIKKALKLGFQAGRKCLIAEIPESVMQSEDKEVIKAIIRGVFDTDGCFRCDRSRAKTTADIWKKTHYYIPEIEVSSVSEKLLRQLQFLLSKLGIFSKVRQRHKKGFKNNRNIHDSYALEVRRIEEVKKWFQIIGTNNPRHKTKYEVWKRFGHLAPRTTLKERLNMLNGGYLNKLTKFYIPKIIPRRYEHKRTNSKDGQR